jgi:phytoene synthase
VSGAADHCLALVREHDRDRYLSTLFAPDDRRRHLLALYAFDIEIRRIPLVVSEAQIGLIRLQWWRDTIESGAGGGHPVAEDLQAAIASAQLPKQALLDLLDAHEFDLYADPMSDLVQLEGYLGETSSRLIQMAMMILDREAAPRAAAVAGLAGVAHGLASILMMPARRGPFLPVGLTVNAAGDHAARRLAEARSRRSDVAASLLPALLPVRITDLMLAKLRASPDSPSQPSQFRRLISMWWAARRETF